MIHFIEYSDEPYYFCHTTNWNGHFRSAEAKMNTLWISLKNANFNLISCMFSMDDNLTFLVQVKGHLRSTEAKIWKVYRHDNTKTQLCILCWSWWIRKSIALVLSHDVKFSQTLTTLLTQYLENGSLRLAGSVNVCHIKCRPMLQHYQKLLLKILNLLYIVNGIE